METDNRNNALCHSCVCPLTIASPTGFNGACSVHEWSGVFQGQSVRFKMTSVCGHVMSLDFPGKFNNWDRVDPVSVFCCLFLPDIVICMYLAHFGALL